MRRRATLYRCWPCQEPAWRPLGSPCCLASEGCRPRYRRGRSCSPWNCHWCWPRLGKCLWGSPHLDWRSSCLSCNSLVCFSGTHGRSVAIMRKQSNTEASIPTSSVKAPNPLFQDRCPNMSYPSFSSPSEESPLPWILFCSSSHSDSELWPALSGIWAGITSTKVRLFCPKWWWPSSFFPCHVSPLCTCKASVLQQVSSSSAASRNWKESYSAFDSCSYLGRIGTGTSAGAPWPQTSPW